MTHDRYGYPAAYGTAAGFLESIGSLARSAAKCGDEAITLEALNEIAATVEYALEQSRAAIDGNARHQKEGVL